MKDIIEKEATLRRWHQTQRITRMKVWLRIRDDERRNDDGIEEESWKAEFESRRQRGQARWGGLAASRVTTTRRDNLVRPLQDLGREMMRSVLSTRRAKDANRELYSFLGFWRSAPNGWDCCCRVSVRGIQFRQRPIRLAPICRGEVCNIDTSSHSSFDRININSFVFFRRCVYRRIGAQHNAHRQ